MLSCFSLARDDFCWESGDSHHTLTNPGLGAGLARRVLLSGGWGSGSYHPLLISVPVLTALALATPHRAAGIKPSPFALCVWKDSPAFLLPFCVCSSANATPEFEGRGGDELGTEIANTLYRIFHNKSSVDLEALCVSPREHCWVLYVDVLVGTAPHRGPETRPAGFPSRRFSLPKGTLSTSGVRLGGKRLVSCRRFFVLFFFN